MPFARNGATCVAREGAWRNEIHTAGTDPRSVARDTIAAAAAADTTPIDLATGTPAAHTRDRAAQDTTPGAASHGAETPGTTATDTTADAAPPADRVVTVDETITAPSESEAAGADAATGEEAAARRVLELVLTEGGGRDGELGARLEVIRAWFGPDALETRRAEYAGVQYRLGHAEKLMALFENEPGSGGHARAQTVLAEVRADLDTATGNLAAAEHAAAGDAATTPAAGAVTGVVDPAAAIADEIATAHTDPARAADAGVFDTAEAVLTDPDPAAAATGGGGDGRATAEVVQDALDLAGVGETIDWGARGAAAFDPAAPLVLPDPAGDGVFVTATRRLGRRATTAIADAWRAGAREALAAATREQRRDAIRAIGHDERVREATLGRRSTDLPATGTDTDPFTAAVHTVAGEYHRGCGTVAPGRGRGAARPRPGMAGAGRDRRGRVAAHARRTGVARPRHRATLAGHGGAVSA